jgi:ketosteroid isomerase-like protein
MSARVDMVRASFGAYAAGDFDALADMMHPDVEVHDWPEAADPRVWRGIHGLRQANDEWGQAWETMDVEATRVVETGDVVFAELRNTGRGRGSAIEMVADTFGVYTFRGDRVAKVQFFMDRGAALDAAGLTDEQIREETT